MKEKKRNKYNSFFEVNEERKHIHKLISSATNSWKKKDSKKLSALGHCLVPTLQLHFFQLMAYILYYDIQYSGSYLQYLIVAGFDLFSLKLYIKTRKQSGLTYIRIERIFLGNTKFALHRSISSL